jgi:hypothetical protein
MTDASVLTARIERRICILRGEKVMLSTDLAALYDVEVRLLNRAVQRNRSRFPEDFMFQLTKKEFVSLKSQIGISGRKGSRRLPYAFTEHGVAMLSSVLNSERAVAVNIEIVRAFVWLQPITFVRVEQAFSLLAGFQARQLHTG